MQILLFEIQLFFLLANGLANPWRSRGQKNFTRPDCVKIAFQRKIVNIFRMFMQKVNKEKQTPTSLSLTQGLH